MNITNNVNKNCNMNNIHKQPLQGAGIGPKRTSSSLHVASQAILLASGNSSTGSAAAPNGLLSSIGTQLQSQHTDKSLNLESENIGNSSIIVNTTLSTSRVASRSITGSNKSNDDRRRQGTGVSSTGSRDDLIGVGVETVCRINTPDLSHRQKHSAEMACPILGCDIRPTISSLYGHITNHMRGVVSGSPQFPSDQWLTEHKKAKCVNCDGLFATSGVNTHLRRCRGRVQRQGEGEHKSEVDFSLPTLEEVSACIQPVLHVVLPMDRPAFARVLQEALEAVIRHPTSVEAITRLQMLPKCVIPAQTRAGRNKKHTQVTTLCRKWERGAVGELWEAAKRND